MTVPTRPVTALGGLGRAVTAAALLGVAAVALRTAAARAGLPHLELHLGIWALLAGAALTATGATVATCRTASTSTSTGWLAARALAVLTALLCAAAVGEAAHTLPAAFAGPPLLHAPGTGFALGAAAAAIAAAALVTPAALTVLAPLTVAATVGLIVALRAGSAAVQAAAVLLSLLVLLRVGRTRTRRSLLLRAPAVTIAVSFVVLLLPLSPLGSRRHGASAWVSFGGVTVTPAEFARIGLLAGTSALLARHSGTLDLWRRGATLRTLRPALLVVFGPLLAALTVLGALNDLGPALVLTVGIGTQVALCLGWRYSVAGVALASSGATAAAVGFAHVRDRFHTWSHPAGTAVDAARHLAASGGMTGRGLGAAPTHATPGAVPAGSTDLVLAQVTAELGLLTALTVLVVHAVLWLRIWRTGTRTAAPTPAAVFACSLAAASLAQVALVTAGTTRLLPLVGLTVPYVSVGGSSVVATTLAVAAALTATSNRTPMTQARPGTRFTRRAGRAWPALTAPLLLGALALTLISHPAGAATPLEVADALTRRGQLVTADGTVLAATTHPTTPDLRHRVRSTDPADTSSALLTPYVGQFGAAGIEAAWSGALRCGTRAVLPARTDPAGATAGARSIRGANRWTCTPADVVLTVDQAAQQALYEILADTDASAVVLDFRTGAVVAAVATGRTWHGRAVTPWTRLPTGSAVKPLIAAAALDVGVDTRTPVTTGYPVTDSTGQVVATIGNHGTCGGDSLAAAMAVSCNSAFALLATRVGLDRLSTTAAKLGWDSTTLSGNPLEPAQLLASTHASTPLLTALAGIGQGDVEASPLHLAALAAAIADNGQYAAPHAVAAVCPDGTGSGSSGALWTAQRRTARAFSRSTAQTVQAAMRAVVDHGTGTALSDLNRTGQSNPAGQVAAKTGTATTAQGSLTWTFGYDPRSGLAFAVALRPSAGHRDRTGGHDVAPRVLTLLDKLRRLPPRWTAAQPCTAVPTSTATVHSTAHAGPAAAATPAPSAPTATRSNRQ